MKKYFGFIFIIIIGFIPLVGLLHPGLPITHDGQDHVARIANFYQSLLEGNIIPRWAANLNWGYGHPILMFLYPLPSYVTSLFHFLGFSFVDSLKIVFGLAFIISGIAMYFWIRNFLGEFVGIISALLYMFAPYRAVDLYVRGAIGEHVAFIFPPLVMYFMLKLSKKYSFVNFFGGGISIAALILSHNAISIMFLPVIILYGILLVYQNKKSKDLIYQYSSMLVCGIGLSAFFLIPALYEGKYTLRDIVTGHNEYAKRFVTPVQFFIPSWSYGGTDTLTKQIGLAQLFGIFSSLFFLPKILTDKKIKWFYIGALLIMLASLFIMTTYSIFIWRIVTIIQKFQFPWRFLSVVVFASAILGSIGFTYIKKKTIIYSVVIIVVLLIFILYFSYFKAYGYLEKPETFYTGIYNGTTDTGESAPIWSVRFMEKRANFPIEVIKGAAVIKTITRNTIEHVYSIDAKTESRIVENTLYFPGWRVLVNGVGIPIEFQDPLHRGLITFNVLPGFNNVIVVFGDTIDRLISNLISILSVIAIFVFGFLYKKKYVVKN